MRIHSPSAKLHKKPHAEYSSFMELSHLFVFIVCWAVQVCNTSHQPAGVTLNRDLTHLGRMRRLAASLMAGLRCLACKQLDQRLLLHQFCILQHQPNQLTSYKTFLGLLNLHVNLFFQQLSRPGLRRHTCIFFLQTFAHYRHTLCFTAWMEPSVCECSCVILRCGIQEQADIFVSMRLTNRFVHWFISLTVGTAAQLLLKTNK